MKLLVLAHSTYADPPTRKVFDHLAAEGIDVLLAMPKRIRHPLRPAEVLPTPWSTPVRLELLDTWYLHHNGTHVVMKGVPDLIRRHRPDVIHCVMEPWSVTCLFVVASLRTMRGKRPRFGIQAAETLPHHGSPPARVIRQAIYRRVLARADYFIGWSARAVGVAAGLGLNGIPSLSAPAIAVDTDTFRPLGPSERERYRARHGWDDKVIVVGFVGRYEAQKGVSHLLHAMDAAVIEEPGLRLACLGSGSLGPFLEAAASSRSWLKVLPPRDAAGVAEHMAAADLLAMPSLTTPVWDEQFGLVAVEAMACGTPVITTDSGSLPETVGDAGMIVAQHDVVALSRGIVMLARSGTRRADLRARGIERVRSHFAPGPLARLLLPVLVSS